MNTKSSLIDVVQKNKQKQATTHEIHALKKGHQKCSEDRLNQVLAVNNPQPLSNASKMTIWEHILTHWIVQNAHGNPHFCLLKIISIFGWIVVVFGSIIVPIKASHAITIFSASTMLSIWSISGIWSEKQRLLMNDVLCHTLVMVIYRTDTSPVDILLHCNPRPFCG
jgi:hypothetical protein